MCRIDAGTPAVPRKTPCAPDVKGGVQRHEGLTGKSLFTEGWAVHAVHCFGNHAVRVRDGLSGDMFLLQLLCATTLIAEHGGCMQQEVAIHTALRMTQLTIEEIPDEWIAHVRSL